MGAYLGVQQGSQFPPQFVHLTYKPKNPSGDVTKVALVGKGLTFDRWAAHVYYAAGAPPTADRLNCSVCASAIHAVTAQWWIQSEGRRFDD